MTFTVHGTPAPQGSKRHVGRGIIIESSKLVKPWREAVKFAFLESGEQGIAGPVVVNVAFVLPRPKSAKRDAVPGKKPDIDKLLRSTFDGLTEAGAWEDDSRVVRVAASKEYSPFGGFACGSATIRIEAHAMKLDRARLKELGG